MPACFGISLLLLSSNVHSIKSVGFIIDIYNRIVLPCKIRSEMNEPSKPLFENGIVFYVYSDDRCKSKNKYMEEIEYNIKHIKIKEPRVSFHI